jgi:hypothetical protein
MLAPYRYGGNSLLIPRSQEGVDFVESVGSQVGRGFPSKDPTDERTAKVILPVYFGDAGYLGRERLTKD